MQHLHNEHARDVAQAMRNLNLNSDEGRERPSLPQTPKAQRTRSPQRTPTSSPLRIFEFSPSSLDAMTAVGQMTSINKTPPSLEETLRPRRSAPEPTRGRRLFNRPRSNAVGHEALVAQLAQSTVHFERNMGLGVSFQASPSPKPQPGLMPSATFSPSGHPRPQTPYARPQPAPPRGSVARADSADVISPLNLGSPKALSRPFYAVSAPTSPRHS